MPTPPRSAEEIAAHVAVKARGHMPVLDGLRGVAIAVVLAHNTGLLQTHPATPWHKLLYPLHMPGWVGVTLFFALSGFLITGILLDSKSKVASGEYFRSFYVRRTMRIFPLYYAALVLAFLVLPLALPALVRPTPLAAQAFYWSYLCNWVTPGPHYVPSFGHFWSLAVEEQFYLVWPLLVMLASRRALAWLCGGLAVLALVARVWFVARHAPDEATYHFTISRMDGLVLGAAAAIAARTPAVMARIVPRLPRVMLVTGVILLAMVPLTGGFVSNKPLVETVGHSLLAVFFTASLLSAIVSEVRGGPAARALAHPALAALGRYSYAIYVIHPLIADALMPYAQPYVLGPSVSLAALALVSDIAVVGTLSFGAALVSWHLFEKRFLALKDVLAPRSPAAEGAAT